MEKKCFVCQSGKASLFLRTKERSLYKCRFCGLIFVWPHPKRSTLKKLYDKDYYQIRKSKAEISGYRDYKEGRPFLTSYFKRKLKRIRELTGNKKGKLLDIGCALGFFLELAKKEGWEVVGLDVSPYAVDEVKRMGLKAVAGGLSQAKFKRESFDVVTIFHTLEHDPNPIGLLKQIKKILKPGGILVVAVPDQKGLLPKILGKRWHDWRRQAHLFWFSKKNLEIAFKKDGFKIIEIEADDLVRGSFMEIFDTLRRSYPNFLTELSYCLINYLPKSFKLSLEKVPQPPFGDLITFVKK